MKTPEIDALLGKLSQLRGTWDFRDKARIAAEIVEASGKCDWSSYGRTGKNREQVEELLAFGRTFFTEWEVALERRYAAGPGGAEAGAGGEGEKTREGFVDFYKLLVGAELKLCHPGPGTRVCHVGCGAMPASVMMWHKYSGCAVVGIDCDAQSVEQAKGAFAGRLAQDPGSFDPKKVGFLHADGGVMSYADFDVILLSSSVRGKDEVFKRIVETAPKTVTVIERVPSKFWTRMASWESHQSVSFELKESVRLGVLELRKLVRK